MNTPSIGRIVRYVPEWSGVGGTKGEPLPAIITAVHDDGVVSLGVFGRSYFPATATYLEPAGQEHDSVPVPGTWYWPPR